jgi:hypothetical protein
MFPVKNARFTVEKEMFNGKTKTILPEGVKGRRFMAQNCPIILNPWNGG